MGPNDQQTNTYPENHTMKYFHVCKPGNAPTVGQVKSFIISGDRIKSRKAEDGGQNYKIVSAIQRDSYRDSYDNVGYDIEVEPATGQQSAQAPQQRATGGNGNDDRSNRIERQHSQHMAVLTVQMLVAQGVISTLEEAKAKIKDLTDYFQRDVSKSPHSEDGF